MVSSWQNEIVHCDYQRFQPKMELPVIDTKLELKTESEALVPLILSAQISNIEPLIH